jgi:cyclic pyranopterin monophosphate synthase
MRDITAKTSTLRSATATAMVFCSIDTIQLIKDRRIEKGDIFEFAKAAGFFAAKKTDQLLPHCHPVGIDAMTMDFEIVNEATISGIKITSTAQFIGKTGIEMEVLTGISIAALTIYDMLKPVDKNLSIGEIKLLDKKGGKSEGKYFNTPPSCAVLVCSDSTFNGTREDNSGKMIIEMLKIQGIQKIEYKIVPDEKLTIQQSIKEWVAQDIHFVFTTGGTGLGPRDHTVSAVKEILERDADGITEAMRNYGQQRTPLAMMSRSVAGSIAYTTIVTLPGSTAGVTESLQAILPALFHARKMLKGGGH